jgi:tetratricopeptide (TPR) repeat protein
MVGRMTADWISMGLVQTKLVTVAPAEAQSGPSRRAAATQVRGHYYADADSLRIRAEIFDATAGKVIFALTPVAAPRHSPMQAMERVRQQLMGRLATQLDPRLRDWTSSASKPTTFEAYQEYALGVELFLQQEYRRAIAHYTRAARMDSTFTMAQLDAAMAHMNLGEFREADSIGILVARSLERLPPFDRHWLRWMQAHLRGDRVSALHAVRQAAALTTGSEAWYQVGYEARALNRTREAIQALRRLDPAKAGEQGWYPYWGQLTTAYHLEHDHRHELEAARQGRRQYPGILPTLSYEVRALAASGRLTEVNRRLNESFSMAVMPGWNPAVVLRGAADELEAHGYAEEARVARLRGLAWLDTRSEAEQALESSQFLRAQLLYRGGRLADAKALLTTLVQEHPDSVGYAGFLGVLAAQQGDHNSAEKIDRWLATIDRPYLTGLPVTWRARIEARLGRRDRAIDRLREALAQGGQYDLWLHTDPDLANLRTEPAFRELLASKR